MVKPKAVIIGSGIGGLCAGIRLQKMGYQVCIYEQLGIAGGVAGEYRCPNPRFRFDQTASIAIDPSEYDKVFLDVGLNPRDYFSTLPLDVLYQVFLPNGEPYRLYRDIQQQREAFEGLTGQPLEDYFNFVKDYCLKYFLADECFLTKPFSRLRDILNLRTVGAGVKLAPFQTAKETISRYVKQEDFQNLLLFQCLYMGISPYRLLDTYATIPAVAQGKGIAQIKGGMSAYTKGLLKAFLELGGEIQYHAPVEEILRSRKKAMGVRVKGQRVGADLIISNADYEETVNVLLHGAFRPRSFVREDPKAFTMSCSVYLLRLAVGRRYENLAVHNLYLGAQFREEIEGIFTGALPQKPPVYLYCPAAVDETFGDEIYSTLNLMIRVPNLSHEGISWDRETRGTLRRCALDALREMTQDPQVEERILFEEDLTPVQLRDRFHLRDGAAFGIGHSLTQSIMLRPQAKSPYLDRLYFVGASTHPGNGVTMVMKSAQIAADLIAKEHPITTQGVKPL